MTVVAGRSFEEDQRNRPGIGGGQRMRDESAADARSLVFRIDAERRQDQNVHQPPRRIEPARRQQDMADHSAVGRGDEGQRRQRCGCGAEGIGKLGYAGIAGERTAVHLAYLIKMGGRLGADLHSGHNV